MNECGCVPVRLYSQKKVAVRFGLGVIVYWPLCYILLESLESNIDPDYCFCLYSFI